MSLGTLGRRKGSGLRTAFAAALICALFAQSAVALGAPSDWANGAPQSGAQVAQVAPFSAQYNAAPPATMGAGTDAAVPISLTNTGTETWRPFAPPAVAPGVGDVAVSYHWYTVGGEIVVWDGLRSSLGAGEVAPQGTRSTVATVRAPTQPGSYFLRFALVKEGVEWAAPSQGFAAQVNPAYSARFAQPTVHALLLGKSYTFPVSVTNTGSAPWSSTGTSPVNVSYHWFDQSGKVVRWDGERSGLPAEVAPGTGVTVQLPVTAPSSPGTYRLAIDLVREGVGWFSDFGGTLPATVSVVVAPIHFAAQYAPVASADAYTGEVRTLPVSVTNTGNVPWTEADIVNLAYHIHDAAGKLVVWDGLRTPLIGVEPGQSRTVTLTYTAPTAMGDYTLTVDAVREGVAWFNDIGSAPVRLPMKVGSGFKVGYGLTTTPGFATIGARIPVRVIVDNYGPRPLVPTGPNPARLSYHVYTRDGSLVTWDGLRAAFPSDIPANSSVALDIDVQLPSRVGDYVIHWDVVHEGVAWLSGYGITTKPEPIQVQPGVTFYGKGFGHGLGMSQWGAQGMATGALGAPRAGEQIVAHYYPGTTILPIASDNPNQVIRVLLSAPSSVSRYSCGAAFFDGAAANLTSDGGLRVLDAGAGNAEITRVGPGTALQVQVAGSGLVNVLAGGALAYSGSGPVVTEPLNPAVPTNFQEKGLYRGSLRFRDLAGVLRAVNIVNYDDYIKGVVPLEMLSNWHLEAYRAQALAARTYAYNSYKGPSAEYDVFDDQSDQCYGGVKMKSGRQVETEITNRAVDSTAGKLITYNGMTIKSYFASSNGGWSKPVGCWGFNVTIHPDGSVTCGASPPYLTAVEDLADRSVSVPERNRQDSWQVTFTSDEIRDAIIRYRGVDIGPLQSVDLSNRVPAGIGHVVSVKVVGQFLSLDLPADRLLRDNLFLKSTMVRLAPW